MRHSYVVLVPAEPLFLGLGRNENTEKSVAGKRFAFCLTAFTGNVFWVAYHNWTDRSSLFVRLCTGFRVALRNP